MNFSDNQAFRLINNVIDQRINQLTRSGAGIEITWGTVASIDSPYDCSVYLFGDSVPSVGFRLENGIMPNLLDPVRVAMDKRGNRWIEAVLTNPNGSGFSANVRDGTVDTFVFSANIVTSSRLRLTSIVDLDLTSTQHAFQVGADNSSNIAIGPNEIMARFNGATTALNFNAEGGVVKINSNGGASTDGLEIGHGGLRIGSTSNIGPGNTQIQIGDDILLWRSASNVLSLGASNTLQSYNETWIAPTLLNSWENYGATYYNAGYRKDAQGFVHLRGLIRNGTVGSPAFSLPVGYRPSATVLSCTISNALIGRVDIFSSGSVTPASPSDNYWVSLQNIVFKAEA
jgi:hypothetical protein